MPRRTDLTQDAYLEKLCHEAAIRRYGSITPEVQQRLAEEFRLIKKYNLAGFLLLYHEVIKLGRDVMIQQGLSDPSLTLEENPPGRGAARPSLYSSAISSGFPTSTRCSTNCRWSVSCRTIR